MKFNSQTVTVKGTAFEIRELSVGDLLPLIRKLSDDPDAAQLEIMRKSIHMNGKPLGEDFDRLPASALMKLMNPVMQINALGDDEDEGK